MAIFGRRPVTLVLAIAVAVVGVLVAFDCCAAAGADDSVAGDRQRGDRLSGHSLCSASCGQAALEAAAAAAHAGGASNRQSRRGRVGFSRSLKQLARELDWPAL